MPPAAPKAPYIGKSGNVTLDKAVFGEDFHEHLVHEAARAELNARRRGTASTLTRGEVHMTGAKAFRQKGTGRARSGPLSVPQKKGGGVAFGPKAARLQGEGDQEGAQARATRRAVGSRRARLARG